MVRVKRRYIVLTVDSKSIQSQEAFSKELRDTIGQLYGDFGIACLNRGFSIKKYDPKDGYIIICVRKGVHEIAMSAVPLMSSSHCLIHLSGTMRSCLKIIHKQSIMKVRESIAKIEAGRPPSSTIQSTFQEI